VDQADTQLERILTAAEALLRRHGPAKTTLTDVARELGVSHAALYRYVPGKEALRELVVGRWLHALMPPLEAIVAAPGAADQRLAAWLRTLTEAKRRKVFEDPEMFAAYHALANEARGVVLAHVGELRTQVARILRDGMDAGVFAPADPAQAAAAVLTATLAFHHPELVRQAGDRDRVGEFEVVLALVIRGLRTPSGSA
jgi:AcrR family transcriptional regulator